MNYIRKFKRCYPLSYLITDYYTKLLEMLTDNQKDTMKYSALMVLVDKLSSIELKRYSKLSLDEIKTLLLELGKIPQNELSISDARVIARLHIMYDILSNNAIKNDGLFPNVSDEEMLSLADIVNSKILIDAFKLMEKKIFHLICNTDEEKKFRSNLLLYNHQHALLKLNFHYLSEKFGLKSDYNLFCISTIDLEKVQERIFKDTGNKIDLIALARNGIFSDLITFLNSLEKVDFTEDDAESIYDNFYYVSYIEVVLPYLTQEQLKFISSYVKGIDFNSKIIGNDIRRLIRKRINKMLEEEENE